MLQQVDVFGVQPGSQRTLVMGDVSDAIQLKDIQGLGPVKASVSSSPYGNVSGEAITGASIGKRNIIFVMGLNPDWAIQTMAELRTQLYAFFMPLLPVTLQFTSTHLPLVQIAGIVEDYVPVIFSKDPEIQVSVLCGEPDFVAVDDTIVNGVVVNNNAFADVVYEGSVDTGIHIFVDGSATLAAYTGSLDVRAALGADPPDDWDSLIINPVTVNAAYAFELNSIPGSKFVQKVAAGSRAFEANLLAFVGDAPVWPKLRPGANQFAIKATTPGQAWQMSYFARFGGL